MSEVKTKCGMVSIVGRPNVGKSTLLNKLVGEKVAIVTRIPQTTRNQIRGIYSEERGQIVFIDTPGLHLGGDKLDKFMNQTSSGSMMDADCVIYLVDATRKIGAEEKAVAEKVKGLKVPVILGLNKIDMKKKADVPAYISFWEEIKGQSVNDMDNFSLLALSGERGVNTDTLIDIVFGHLPESPMFYDSDTICDTPQRLVIADIIREKLFHLMKQELPHALGVHIEHMQPIKGSTMRIKALIFVERATQKEIVIGKGGSVLKSIGTAARVELEELLEQKVFLDLHVKCRKNWRDNVSLLQELGYTEI